MDTTTFELDLLNRVKQFAHTRFRTFDRTAVAVPGGMFVQVVSGRIRGFGIEPVGDVILTDDNTLIDVDGYPGRFLTSKAVTLAVSAAAATAGLLAGVYAASRRHTQRRLA